MTQWVLKRNGKIVPRRKMRRLAPEEWAREIEIKKRSEFNNAIKAQYGDLFSLPDKTLKNPQDEDDTDDLLSIQEANSKLSRNFGTNYRMLRYIRIKSYFFRHFLCNKEGGKFKRLHLYANICFR